MTKLKFIHGRIVDKYRYGTVNQKHRSMLNPTSVKVYRVTGTQ